MYSERISKRQRLKHKNRRKSRKRQANASMSFKARKERRTARAQTVAMRRVRDERFETKLCKYKEDKRLTVEFYDAWSYFYGMREHHISQLSAEKTQFDYTVDVDQGSSTLYQILNDEGWLYIIPQIRSFLPPSISLPTCEFFYGWYDFVCIQIGNNVILPKFWKGREPIIEPYECYCICGLPKSLKLPESEFYRFEPVLNKLFIPIDATYMIMTKERCKIYVVRKGSKVIIIMEGPGLFIITEANIEDFVFMVLPKMKDLTMNLLPDTFILNIYKSFCGPDYKHRIDELNHLCRYPYVSDNDHLQFEKAFRLVCRIESRRDNTIRFYTAKDMEYFERILQTRLRFKASVKKTLVW